MFHLSQSCHVPHPPNDIYELIDGTMARLPFVFVCGCLISRDPPCACSNVISGVQGQTKHCIHRGKYIWAFNCNMTWQRNKDFFILLPRRYVFKPVCVCARACSWWCSSHVGMKYRVWIFTSEALGDPKHTHKHMLKAQTHTTQTLFFFFWDPIQVCCL